MKTQLTSPRGRRGTLLSILICLFSVYLLGELLVSYLRKWNCFKFILKHLFHRDTSFPLANRVFSIAAFLPLLSLPKELNFCLERKKNEITIDYFTGALQLAQEMGFKKVGIFGVNYSDPIYEFYTSCKSAKAERFW